MTELSHLSMIACGVYAVMGMLAATAWQNARKHGLPTWHQAAWAGLFVLAIALIGLRLFDVEDYLRDFLRDFARRTDSYDGRRDFQRPIAAGLLALIGAAGFGFAYRAAQGDRGRRKLAVMVALASGAAMVLLILFRVISLHYIDVLLYGPPKLNWVADLGLASLIGGSAAYYVSVSRSAIRRGERP